MHPWAARILKCRDVPLTREERLQAWPELLAECRDSIQSQRRRLAPPSQEKQADAETIHVDCLRIYTDHRERVERWLLDHWIFQGMPYMQGFHFVAQSALDVGLSDEDVSKWISLFGLRAYMPMDRIALTVATPQGNNESLYVRNLGPIKKILDQFWTMLVTFDPRLTSHLERFPIVFPALIPCYVSLFAGMDVNNDMIWDDMIALESMKCGLGTLYITSLLTLLMESVRESLLACQDDGQVASILSNIVSSHLRQEIHLTLACQRALVQSDHCHV